MSAAWRFGIAAAGVLATVLLLRRGVVPEEARGLRAAPAVRRPAPPDAVVARPAAPVADRLSEQALVSQGVLDEIPSGVLSGPFTVEGPGEAPDALQELALTASQRTVIDTLVAQRDAVLGEIRRDVETRPPRREEADRLCAKATAAQETCMTSIRSTLLPDQHERFDALVKSGRWGRTLLLIPIGR